VILGSHSRQQTPEGAFRQMTLDDLFRRAAERHPDAPALADPPDREAFTDGAPRRLSYAQADRVVSAIARRLKDLGLKTDAIVAMQLPNTVESALTLLGVLRAGMIAVPLPLLWRQAEAALALTRIGARALITCRRIGPVDHGELAMHIAAETFTIRFLCTFGAQHLDGVVALDGAFDQGEASEPPVERIGNPADHVAVVTFDTAADGLLPVARSHGELIAGGLSIALEGRIARDTVLLGALATSSFAGLATTIVPWLLCGGTMVLHQPFDGAIFSAQCGEHSCDTAVLPAPLVPRLVDAGLVGAQRGPKSVLAVWRTPERFAGGTEWPTGAAGLTDVLAFGEIGLVPARRRADGKPGPIMPGPIAAARSQGDGLVLVDVARSAAGTVLLGGAMVPRHPFPPGVERSGAPRLKVADTGHVDTGYSCRVDRISRALTVDGPPGGIVSVGGYRFVLKELQEMVAGAADGSSLAALPDALAGHRLAGVTSDRNAVRRTLVDQGANPLIVGAFRERRSERATAA